MAETPAAVRFTVADLELFPEDGQRYEIVDGELFVSRAPRFEHQITCGEVTLALGEWNRQTQLGRVIPGPGVIFSDYDSVIPDLVWISHAQWALIAGEDGHFHGAPDLVVEVLSPGATQERRDREAKLRLYSVRGVREYWIVDWRTQTVTVHRRHEGLLRLEATLGREDSLTSPLLPGFAVPIGRLFERA
jgi:Uma2 family endonuclease